jgi:hypothetical protein
MIHNLALGDGPHSQREAHGMSYWTTEVTVEDVAWFWSQVAQAALECEVEGLRRVMVGIHQFATGAIE